MGTLPHVGEKVACRLPNEVEMRNAERLKEIFVSHIADDGSVTLSFDEHSGNAQQVTLPPSLAASLLELLTHVSNGSGVQILPIDKEMTERQAANLLNVTGSYFAKLLDEGEIPFVKSRRHRRIRADDLLAYKKKSDAIRSSALDELIKRDAEMGLV